MYLTILIQLILLLTVTVTVTATAHKLVVEISKLALLRLLLPQLCNFKLHGTRYNHLPAAHAFDVSSI